jgi:exonuclease III
MLRILSWNCRGFPWNKGPKLSWISNDVDIILLVETWEHEESKVPNIDGFTLWSTWNKRSSRRGIGGIACYIKKNISPHARIYKNDPYNQYSWIEITDINNKKTYIAICYFPPINSNFYKKKNLDKNSPYNGLENDISSLRNEGNILLIGDFNARTSSNQAIILSNHSNPNPLWLDEDPTLAGTKGALKTSGKICLGRS